VRPDYLLQAQITNRIRSSLAGAVIMTIVYGHDVAPTNDFFVDLAERHSSLLSIGMFPRSSMFQAFPILRFVPAWFPGAGFKKFCLESRKVAFEMRDIPMTVVQGQIVCIGFTEFLFIRSEHTFIFAEGRKSSRLRHSQCFGDVQVERGI